MIMNNDKFKPGIAGRMSERLITVAEMLRSDEKSGLNVADVGCDHGYVSIYLVQRKIASRAIAMDVRKGPLSGARDNIKEFGLENVISTRLSDGLKELNRGEADALIIAGMGGRLMVEIIDQCSLSELGIKRAVFQPQSDLMEFRQYLRNKGYCIIDEKIIYEDGKYYFPMKVDIMPENENNYYNTLNLIFKGFDDIKSEQQNRICNRYGEHNIIKKDSLLIDYLLHGKDVCESILKCLDKNHAERIKEIEDELDDISFVLKFLEE